MNNKTIGFIGGGRITRIFLEYPGCVLDVDKEEPDLRTPASSFDRFWVADRDGAVLACIACALKDDVAELKKLYVDRSVRGEGVARELVALVEQEARGHGAPQIELWSDTRFETAHAVYLHLGYEQTGRTRDLHDLSHTTEFHFAKEISRGGAESAGD